MADGEAATAAAAPVGQQSEVEKLESEKKRLEEELRYVQLQMTDVLNLNDGLLVELRQKDEILVKREEYFAIVSEKNATGTCPTRGGNRMRSRCPFTTLRNFKLKSSVYSYRKTGMIFWHKKIRTWRQLSRACKKRYHKLI